MGETSDSCLSHYGAMGELFLWSPTVLLLGVALSVLLRQLLGMFGAACVRPGSRRVSMKVNFCSSS